MNRRDDFLIILMAVVVSLTLVGLSGHSVVRAQAACDLDCLNDKIAGLTRRVVALERLTGTSKTSQTGTKKESFRAIADGSAAGTDWTKVEGTDFWFDQSLYGNVAYVTMQGWMENGAGSVRLYDATNSRGVDGSEISVSANARASFYSGNLAIWRGQNQYYVQVKSPAGGTVTVSGIRLKVVTQ